MSLTTYTAPRSVWPGSTIEGRTAGSAARLPATLLAPGNWLVKCVDASTAPPTVISYAQWRLPVPLWEKLCAENGGGVPAQVTDEMRKTFAREHAESCTPDGEPKGLRVEVTEWLEGEMAAANRRCFPADRESYISASGPPSLPLLPSSLRPLQCSFKSRLCPRTNAAGPGDCSRNGASTLRTLTG